MIDMIEKYAITHNGTTQQYTQKKEIIEANIQAPMINLLPYDFWMNNVTAWRNNIFKKNESKRCLIFDFPEPQATWGDKSILVIPVWKLNLTPGQIYTLSVSISNHTYSTSTPFWTSFYKVDFSNNATAIPHNSYSISTFRISNGVHYFTFTADENMKSLNLNWGQNNWYPRDEYFELEILGLTPGDQPITRGCFSSNDNLTIYSTNSDFILGKSKVTKEIRRHITQVERDIVKQENKYGIDWR